MRAVIAACASLTFAAACQTTPSPAPDEKPLPPPPANAAKLGFAPAKFETLPGWGDGDQDRALRALVASCPRFTALPDKALIGAAFQGEAGDWKRVCAAAGPIAASADASSARAFFEAQLTPFAISGKTTPDGLTTAYYEPVFEARRAATPPFIEPILALPDDAVPGAGPSRREARARADKPLAWLRLSDVVFLQIQGSGRLVFEDGANLRAAYAAHNGKPYTSILREMIDLGMVPPDAASNAAAKAWLDRTDPDFARVLVDRNQRAVFFALKPIGEAAAGPVGAAKFALVAGASIAVDPSWHSFGSLYWVAAEGQGAPPPQLSVAQDTGGAILGPMRADFFFGTGEAAGEAAARIKHRARWWALAPRRTASQ